MSNEEVMGSNGVTFVWDASTRHRRSGGEHADKMSCALRVGNVGVVLSKYDPNTQSTAESEVLCALVT